MNDCRAVGRRCRDMCPEHSVGGRRDALVRRLTRQRRGFETEAASLTSVPRAGDRRGRIVQSRTARRAQSTLFQIFQGDLVRLAGLIEHHAVRGGIRAGSRIRFRPRDRSRKYRSGLEERERHHRFQKGQLAVVVAIDERCRERLRTKLGTGRIDRMPAPKTKTRTVSGAGFFMLPQPCGARLRPSRYRPHP